MHIKNIFLIIFISSLTSVAIIGSFLIFGKSSQGEGVLGSPVSVENAGTITAPIANLPDMIERVNPAVVSIVVTKDVPIYEQYYEEYNPFGGWFGGGFAVPRVRENGTEEQEVGGGSGFLVSPEGMIVTNRHVVSDDDARYSVILNDGTTYPVTIKARDTVLDIAILQLEEVAEGETFSYLTFGDSQTLRLGEPVIAIGNALAEFRNSISVGIVSGLSRSIMAGDGRGMSEQLNHVIQTDAAINPGNSGGPLLNSAGEVVGVNVAVSLGAENIGFALPGSAVEKVVSSVQEFGEIRRAFLGIRYTMITPRLVVERDLPVTYGALISGGNDASEMAVEPNSPADKAGLREGDIVLALDGVELRNTDFGSLLQQKNIGQIISLKIQRDGKEEELTAILEQAP